MSKIYATWEAAEKLGVTRKMLWNYHKQGYIEGTLDSEGFLTFTEEQIALAKFPPIILKHMAEKRALKELNARKVASTIGSALEKSHQIPMPKEPIMISLEREDIQRWASRSWREFWTPSFC